MKAFKIFEKCGVIVLSRKVKHRGAPTFWNHSGVKSKYFPYNKGNPWILNFELKSIKSITTAILVYCNIVIFLKVDIVYWLTE